MSDYFTRATADLSLIEDLIDELLLAGGVFRPPAPDNLLSLFDLSASVVISRQRPLGAVRAALQFREDHWLIILNDDLPLGAQRFSLFHEGFHILQRIGRAPQGHNDEYREWLADAFAARMLMPRRWLEAEANQNASWRQLCARFGVTRKALERRCRELGIIGVNGVS